MKIVRKEIISDDRNYWDITIPDNHNFVLENGSVVHNCGSGVGFSVERQYVNQLPEVPDKLYDSDTMIVVKDSKEGWSKALRQVIVLLYSGEIPEWDLSKLRPAGAPLKTFGGRSSGPGPLDDLFKFVVKTFRAAQGRKLTSIECHDIMCKIGEIVVVGGVRRAALISLSNLSDERMRHAKSGAWWEANNQRALSNNSAVYTEKPDEGTFMREWLSLFESKSGERGIFNREAAKKQTDNGRRNPNFEFGMNPCGEIILRPNSFCNLTEVIVRSNDTLDVLSRKVRLASILGTFQSTLTNFPYLRKIWSKNSQEERLLGVSLTGIYDNPLLNNPDNIDLPNLLTELKNTVVNTNKEFADSLGIEQSVATTTVKPSGNISQLTNSSSGIHPRFSKYYIRRVRNDNKDPLTQFLIECGVPHEPDVLYPLATTVFSFPQKSPDGAITRDQLTTIDHMKLWMKYKTYWTEHNPSVTIQVKDGEWPEVGSWVWKNFDDIVGMAFLPYDGGSYRQAPYEQITEVEFLKLLENIPKEIDWDKLIEKVDETEGAQTLSCASGGCEV